MCECKRYGHLFPCMVGGVDFLFPPSSPTATVAPCCLPGLTFPDFDLAPKREVWLLRTGFGIAPGNKLVCLMWFLWALRSFRSFTLHLHYKSISAACHSQLETGSPWYKRGSCSIVYTICGVSRPQKVTLD